MTSNVRTLYKAQKDPYLLQNNGRKLVINQPNVLETLLLYEAIKENMKLVSNLFTDTKTPTD